MSTTGLRKVTRWVTADGREWPDARAAAEHERHRRLVEWFLDNVGSERAERLAKSFDSEFSAMPREKPNVR